MTDNRRVYLKAELKTQLLAVLLTKEQGTQQRGGFGEAGGAASKEEAKRSI